LTSKIRRLGIVAALTIIILFGIVLIAVSYSQVGVASATGTGGLPLSAYDVSAVPQSVAEDATMLATELYGDSQEKCNDFVNQLLSTYKEANNKDFIVFFNSGGWGSNLVETSRGWWSISDGIQTELSRTGYTSLVLNYQRTVKDIRGCLNELVEMFTDYPSKAKDLAYRVEFITEHVPETRVILAGESIGTVICDSAMNILEDNPRVYSIQTGPPPWHKSVTLDRKLLMDSNGIVPDSFSQGDFATMIYTNIKVLFGMSGSDYEPGRVLRLVMAPGHYYSWQYSSIYSQITGFLDENFKIKWR